MFERFTERARRSVVLGQEELRLLQHSYYGPEHLLLGLIREGGGGAARALSALDITLDAVRGQVTETMGRGSFTSGGHIPFTPGAKHALERSLPESLASGQAHIGTGHILLGLIDDDTGPAPRSWSGSARASIPSASRSFWSCRTRTPTTRPAAMAAGPVMTLPSSSPGQPPQG